MHTFSRSSDSKIEPDPYSASCLNPSVAYWPSAHIVIFLECVKPRISLKCVSCKVTGKFLG